MELFIILSRVPGFEMGNDNTQRPGSRLGRRNYLKALAGGGAFLWGGSEAASAHSNELNDTNTGHKTDIDFDKDDLYYTSVATLAGLIREEILSPVDVVDAFLERINEQEDAVNAFITLTGDRAREAAHEAERAIQRGDDLGPLHGVPIGVKDLQPLEGVRYTSGALPLSDRVVDDTAIYIERLLEAGAIVLGTTNTPEFGYTGKTDNLLVGPTSTPFEIGRNSGGSSGGSAAAVAAGMLPAATGSDGAGSLRIPASLCSTVGFKPSFRRVPNPGFVSAETFTHNGVETRTVEDTALLLSVGAGPTDPPTGPHVLPRGDVNWLGALDKGVEDFSVAYSPDMGVYPVDDRTHRVVEENVGAIEEAGATVEQVDVDLGVSYDELIAGLRIMWGMLYVSLPENLEQYDVDILGEDRDKFPKEFLDFIEYGRTLSGLEVKRNDETLRTSVLNGVQDVFEDHDVLVTPTVAVPPFSNDIVGPTEINGVQTDPILGWLITAVFNMTGNPAASIPAGFTADRGLPVGMQVVGPLLGDEEVITACAEYERVNPWHDDYQKRIQLSDTEASSNNTANDGNGKAKCGDS